MNLDVTGASLPEHSSSSPLPYMPNFKPPGASPDPSVHHHGLRRLGGTDYTLLIGFSMDEEALCLAAAFMASLESSFASFHGGYSSPWLIGREHRQGYEASLASQDYPPAYLAEGTQGTHAQHKLLASSCLGPLHPARRQQPRSTGWGAAWSHQPRLQDQVRLPYHRAVPSSTTGSCGVIYMEKRWESTRAGMCCESKGALP
ncbi:uncharacterized protein LOC124656457 [Lolium rigidum]|uniref:uncharacterized protein LOC124656457 n=1 Tax=Lolium rigidum TaxID=89674 RepID=UPI001F5E0095|nr:uncharacterized protein LOC124656457 [Lolium rigidum]